MIFPVFLPHFGCKTRCIYCNQNHITLEPSSDNIAGQLARLFNNKDKPVEVALYGGNPFGLDKVALSNLFKLFKPFSSRIREFRLSAKPGPVSAELIKVLKSNHVRTIELGVPCFNNTILAGLNRGHTAEEAISVFKLLSQEAFEVGIQLMIGLPEENNQDLINSIKHIEELGPSFVRVYPLLVLEDTPLHHLYINGEFNPDSLDVAVRKASLIYASCWKLNIQVIKMGLTENDVLKERIVAGPYHPAFGYIVKSEVFRCAVEEICFSSGITGNVMVHLRLNDISHLIGLGRSNISKLSQKGIFVNWLAHDDIKIGHFIVETDDTKVSGDLSNSIPRLLF
jgi:histone acetyltransferase (RNA polymerase elongator complex component)